MRRIIQAQTGSGQSNAAVLDPYQNPFTVGMGVVVAGTVTYTIQHTFDDILDSNVTPTWFDHSTMAGLTANQDGNYAFPVAAVRVNVTAGAGTATLTLLQSGPR